MNPYYHLGRLEFSTLQSGGAKRNGDKKRPSRRERRWASTRPVVYFKRFEPEGKASGWRGVRISTPCPTIKGR